MITGIFFLEKNTINRLQCRLCLDKHNVIQVRIFVDDLETVSEAEKLS